MDVFSRSCGDMYIGPYDQVQETLMTSLNYLTSFDNFSHPIIGSNPEVVTIIANVQTDI